MLHTGYEIYNAKKAKIRLFLRNPDGSVETAFTFEMGYSGFYIL